MKMTSRFSKGNRKLSKNVLIWNLPIKVTCPGAGSCKEWCYENKIQRIYKQTVPFRDKNRRLSKGKGFVGEVVAFLVQRPERFVRIHEAGDFYNQEYLDKWKEIARSCPTKAFFCFTKSFHLDLWTNLPKNFQIMQSYGSKWDHKIDWNHATNRALDKDQTKRSDEEWCSNGGCGDLCTKCIPQSNIHLVNYKH